MSDFGFWNLGWLGLLWSKTYLSLNTFPDPVGHFECLTLHQHQVFRLLNEWSISCKVDPEIDIVSTQNEKIEANKGKLGKANKTIYCHIEKSFNCREYYTAITQT